LTKSWDIVKLPVSPVEIYPHSPPVFPLNRFSARSSTIARIADHSFRFPLWSSCALKPRRRTLSRFLHFPSATLLPPHGRRQPRSQRAVAPSSFQPCVCKEGKKRWIPPATVFFPVFFCSIVFRDCHSSLCFSLPGLRLSSGRFVPFLSPTPPSLSPVIT